MAYEANLYKKVFEKLGAPKLVPNTSVPQNEGSTSFTRGIPGLVDIHRAYRWTLSQPVAREIVPMLQLTEYKLVLSSEVSGFLYTLRGEVDNLNVIKQETVGNIQRTGTALANTIFSNIEKAAQEAADASQEVAQNTLKQDFAAGADDQSGLKPYTGLYAIDPTGWSYNLPYLGAANMVSPNNTWGEGTAIKDALKQALGGVEQLDKAAGTGASSSGGITAVKGGGAGADPFGSLKGLFNIYQGATKAALTLGGGALIRESPQSFTGTGSDKIDVTFYLLNTVNVKDIQRNWEFCYLFTYQNLSNRKGINLLDPPCLYGATIPGYKQLPICWVTGLQITNVGTTRLIDIRTGEVDDRGAVSPYIKMIPEAYKVTFTLESSLRNARNIFQFVEDPSYKVSVTGV